MFYIFTTPSLRGLSLSISLSKNEQRSRAAQLKVLLHLQRTPSALFVSFFFTLFRHSLNFRQKADEAYPVPQAGHAHIGRNYTLR